MLVDFVVFVTDCCFAGLFVLFDLVLVCLGGCFLLYLCLLAVVCV